MIGAQIKNHCSKRLIKIGSQDFTLSAGSIIPADKKISFTITAATNYSEGFRLKNNVGTDVYVSYTITDGSNNSVVKDTAFLTATAAEAYTGKAATLTFTPATVKSAGTYSDTLTITVALTDSGA